MAENHPVGFQWVVAAREKGAKIIHVDPRFNRTSAMADIWVPLRAGSDILFLGAIINYVSALFALAHVRTLPPQGGALIGIAVGTAFNFVASRYLVFRTSHIRNRRE